MNFAAILAGGTGQRMNNNIPKQFIDLCGKPIIIHTIESISNSKLFDYIILAIHPDYTDYLKNLLIEFNINNLENILIISGGKDRLGSIENVINKVNEYSSNDKDILLLHDAVRPFVSQKILNDSIVKASEYGACVAVMPAVDTMYLLNTEGIISEIPPRNLLFHGQAPDTFNFKLLKNAFETLTNEEKNKITGTSQICALKGINVHTIEGSYQNMKITTKEDLDIAKNICMELRQNESLCS